MLDTLDIVIGFSLVMLIMSMAVTMLTQVVGSGMFNMQGVALRLGVARLLALLDRGLTRQEASRIADHILRNPLVGKPKMWGDRNKLASVVHREELVKLVLDFAADGDAERSSPEQAKDEKALRNKLRKSLDDNGITEPAAVLKRIRDAVIELEKSNPELSQDRRTNIAILNFAASEYLSKFNSWFDQTIDRVSAIFTTRIRIVTLLISAALAFVVQLDAIELINRLSVDEDLRSKLVASAIDRVNKPADQASSTAPQPKPQPQPQPQLQATKALAPAGTPSPSPSPAQGSGPKETKVAVALRESGVNELEGLGVLAFPQTFDEWCNRWTLKIDRGRRDPGLWRHYPMVLHFLGILLSAALLSLGAPFWYAMMSDLVKLRSVVSRKDDAQRAERQSTQAPNPATGSAIPQQFRGGEAGDPNAFA